MTSTSTYPTPASPDQDLKRTPPSAGSGRWGHWRADIEASLVVFLVALPLSLGIAVASDAPVVSGIIAAIVGGIVAGLVGGVPLQVTGPAAGLTAVVAGLVAEHGWKVTCLITVLAGIVQIGFGLSRVARGALAISPAVVHGMLAGIGITIVLGQLHVLLGGQSRSSALDSLRELPEQVLGLHTPSALLGLGTIAVTLAWRRVPRPLSLVPGPLVSVTALTAISLPFTVDRVDLPGNILSAVSLPELPESTWVSVLIGVITVALVASVESTLSAAAVEKMQDGPRGNLDRELIGQGAANSLSGLLGGLPVTGVIVRSSANVRAGAQTKWSAVLHAVWIALFAVLLVPVVRQIPLSVLAGLLVVIGIGLVDLGHVRTIARHGEAMVWLITVSGVVLFNLLEGVIAGIAAALFYAGRRTIFAPIEIIPPSAGSSSLARRAHSWRVVVQGTLTFISLPRLARQLARIPADAPVRLELLLDYLDQAAAEHLGDWIEEHRRGGGTVEIDELGSQLLSNVREGRPPRQRVEHVGPPPSLAPWAPTQSATPDENSLPLLDGVERYQERLADRMRPVLSDLKDGQSPTTLFITCADSRLVPNVITSSGPGDLFTVRNVGNLVPHWAGQQPGAASDSADSTLAAVEYAISVLKVSAIAVCGHSGCGAMKALLSGQAPGRGALDGWLAEAAPSLAALPGWASDGEYQLCEADQLSQINVVQQLEHLRQHPLVAEALSSGALTLVGMWFDIAEAEARVLDPATGHFQPLRRSVTV